MPLQPSVEATLGMLTNGNTPACLYKYVKSIGLLVHVSLKDLLVSLLVESGYSSVASKCLNGLICPNEQSCNAVLTALVKCGQYANALCIYKKMQELLVQPNGSTFVALLKACIELKDMATCHMLHSEIAKSGLLERDLVVGNTLVDMHAKFGLLVEAQEVFDNLPRRNVVSWNALIGGYAKHECGKEAICCFERMQEQGVLPNVVTFVRILKACGQTREIKKGREIHGEITRGGWLEENLFLCNALVDMYAKCGWLTKAQEIFDGLRSRDVVGWNALIAGYSNWDCDEEALACYDKMLTESLSPNAATYPSVFKSYGASGAIVQGIRVHTEVARKDYLLTHPMIGNAVVEMYAKCGLLQRARELFDQLPTKDVVAWTTIISAFVNCEHGEEALKYLERMRLAGVSPNAVTFVCSLRACSISRAEEEGRGLHMELARRGLLKCDSFLGNALMDMYVTCGSLTKAWEVFDSLPVRDVVSWTTLLGGYTKYESCEETILYYKQMQIEGLSPNVVTKLCNMKACGKVGAVKVGGEIHAEIVKDEAAEGSLVLSNTLIDMYAKMGSLAKAQEVFDGLLVRDVVSWTALITGYAEHGCYDEALCCYEKMKLNKVLPNAVTYMGMLKTCQGMGAVEKGREMHADICRRDLLDRDMATGNALVDMYAKCGSLSTAQEVFDMLRARDVVSWNSIITGSARLGEGWNAVRLFERMRNEGEWPDLVTFTSVLSACSHVGLMVKGQLYFEVMSKDYGMCPMLEQVTCMAGLLGGVGDLDGALVLIDRLGLHCDQVLWQTLLDACQKWGNLELGNMAYGQAVHLNDTDASSYMSLCKIFAKH